MLSAVGLVLVVMGILAADNNLWLMLGLLVAGALVLVRVLPPRPRQGARRRGAAAVDGAVPQPHVQPRPRHAERPVALLMGTSFVVSAYLQVVRGYNAIETGVIFTAATVGILVSSLAAERLAKRYAAADPHPGRLRRHASSASASCSPW